MTTASEIMDVSLIFLNYKDSTFNHLENVETDGDFMKEILENSYKKSLKSITIETVKDSEDIKEGLKKLQYRHTDR